MHADYKKEVWENLMLEESVDFHSGGIHEVLELENWSEGYRKKRRGGHRMKKNKNMERPLVLI